MVPKITVEVFGKKRIVQPICKCESEAHTNDLKRLTEASRKEQINRLFSISHMGERLETATFKNFIQRDGTESAFVECLKYAKEFGQRKESLLIWGNYGNGKSHLAAAVANSLRTFEKTVVFCSVPELLARIRSTFNKAKDSESEHEIMNALLKCDLLILDDIGSEKPTEWVADVLFRIIDGRYRKEAHVFYTSNLKPSLLEERLGGRIYDRILETTLPVQNRAPSYRQEMARERFEKMKKEGS